MYLWDNEDCETQPGDSAPHGQKCLYKVRFKDTKFVLQIY